MRLLITGAHGLLGQKLALVFGRESSAELLLTDLASETFFTNKRFDYHQLDITRRGDVKSLVGNYRPDVIINTAALTDVDGCETDRRFAWDLNVDGLKNLLIPARRLDNCLVLQISSDYVFDGGSAPYDERSRPQPLSYYGKSKLAAENALLASPVRGVVIRTQVLYGTGYGTRKNFVTWVLSMLEEGKPFRVVTDQTGNPTMADDLAYAIFKIVDKGCKGLYHVSGPESVSRYDFAGSIATVFGFDAELVLPTTSIEIGQAANRPENSTFITLKFEADCDFRLCNVVEGLRRLKLQYKDGASHLDLLSDASFT